VRTQAAQDTEILAAEIAPVAAQVETTQHQDAPIVRKLGLGHWNAGKSRGAQTKEFVRSKLRKLAWIEGFDQVGGASGGNGGFVETSGKNYLDFRGKVDLLAAHGTNGTLLLDPNDITIDDGTGTPTITGVPGTGDEIYFSPTTSYVSSATINSELATTNVLVQTGAASGGSNAGGSIIVASTASLNWTTNNTLALSASQDIQINSAINGPSGTLELVAANGSISQIAGAITVASLAASAPSGSVSLTNSSNVISNAAGTASSGGFALTTSNGIAKLAPGFQELPP